jgi:hypothetical protein
MGHFLMIAGPTVTVMLWGSVGVLILVEMYEMYKDVRSY